MKKKILLAEDDPDISYILKSMLSNVGYEVKSIPTGKPLLQPNAERPDLYILDRQMPDVDGIDVCKHLKSDYDTKNIPVIMVSACPDLGFFAKNVGAEGFLEKPFKMRDLLTLIAKYI
jgi:CheY-like chemotaxis protein